MEGRITVTGFTILLGGARGCIELIATRLARRINAMVERSTTVVVSTVSLAAAGGIVTDQRALRIETMVIFSASVDGWPAVINLKAVITT